MFWKPLLLADQNKNTAEVPQTFLESFVFDEQCVLGTNLSVQKNQFDFAFT